MPASYQQGYDAQAKQSTRYLARGTDITDLDVDLSQRLTNLTAGATYVLEASPASARFDFSHPRTIGARIEINSTDTGTIHRLGAASPTRLDFNSATVLRAVVNNSSVGTLTLTGLDGTRDDVVVAWTSRANPDTTGAANAVESTLHGWNVTNSTYERSTFTHAASTTKTQTAYFGAADNVGTAVFSGVMTAIWFENRMQTAAEIANDWVSARTPPTTVLEAGHQGHPPAASTIETRNHYHGPSALWCADATKRLLRRTMSPLWNECLNTQPTWTDALLTAADPMMRGAPDNTEYRMHTAWRRVVPVPPMCNAVWCRVQLRSWVSSGAAVPIGVRMYSFNRPPSALAPADGPPDPLVSYYATATITRDDTATDGEYTTLGFVPMAIGRAGLYAGTTTLCLALNVDPAASSGNDANANIMVRAVHVVPVFRDIVGGLPFGEAGG